MKEIVIPKIAFAPIDTKDFGGYKAVAYGYMLELDARGHAHSVEAHVLLLDMELEYLTELLELQSRIRDKYGMAYDRLDDCASDPADKPLLAEEEWLQEHEEERRKVRHLYYT